jgi:hypothetical protein
MAQKDFIKEAIPTIKVIVVVTIIFSVIEYYDGDLQSLLIFLGFLMAVGLAVLHTELIQIQTAPRVRVFVHVEIGVRESQDPFEGATLYKTLNLPIIPRIGDHIKDDGVEIGKVTGVSLAGYGNKIDITPSAAIWCTREVWSADAVKELDEDLKREGWRGGLTDEIEEPEN